MNGAQDLPAALAAVSVSVVGGRPGSSALRLHELVDLFTQVAPLFSALHSYDVSAMPSAESALLIFYDQQAAAQAVELFNGYPLDTISMLEVHLADKHPLQRLVQTLLKCMQSAGSGPPSSPLAQPPPPHHTAASHAASLLGMQPSWLQGGPLGTPRPAPTFPPQHAGAGGASSRHSDLAAATAAAWGTPPSGYQPPDLSAAQQAPQPAGHHPDAWGPAHSLPAAEPGAGYMPVGAGSNGHLQGSPFQPPPGAWEPQRDPHSIPTPAQHAQHGAMPAQHAQQHPYQHYANGHTALPAGEAVPQEVYGGGDGWDGADDEMMKMHLRAAALRKQQDEFLAQHRAAQQAQQHQEEEQGASAPAVAAPMAPQPPVQPPKQAGYAAVAAAAAQRSQEERRVLTIPRPPHPTAALAARRAAANGDAANGGEDEQGWEEVGGKSSSRRTGGAADQASSSGGVGSGELSLSRKLYVKNILQSTKPDQIRALFGRYGSLEECVKFPEVQYAFVTFHSAAAAATAFAELNQEMVPSLGGSTPLWIEFREVGPGGGGVAAKPTTPKAAATAVKVAAGKGPHPTFEGSINRDPLRNPLPTKKHEGDAQHITTKLWVGGISGGATEDDLKRVFGKYGPVFGIELRPAPEPGRKDQWAFVNFKKEADSLRAFEELTDKVLPDLTGSMRLKLRFKVPIVPPGVGKKGR